MSDYDDGYTYWTKILCNEKLSNCELCGSSYEIYKDHLRGLYHFYRGYEFTNRIMKEKRLAIPPLNKKPKLKISFNGKKAKGKSSKSSRNF